MARIYVGNTDNDWFDFLSSLSDIDEVNFWKPSPGNFKAIGEGERLPFVSRVRGTRSAASVLSLGAHGCQFKQRGKPSA
jgi:hypothetical protein